MIGDAGDPNNTIDKILQHDSFKDIKQPIVFDIVSCQFSMHYLFESESKIRAFLHNVSCRLEVGGFFIGSTVDADKVISLVRAQGGEDLRISNKFYSIQLGQNTYPKETMSPYGQKFFFYLKEAVGKERLSEGRPIYVPEYLVIFSHLEKLAEEYGLRLVEKRNFHEFYDRNIEDKNFERLFNLIVWKGLSDNPSEEDLAAQWEICGLYCIFAFEKIGRY